MKHILIVISLIISASLVSCKKEGIRLNEVQVIGSHNSYKIAIEKPLWEYLYQHNPNMATSLQYGHISIKEQLDLGLRNLELDVFHDPKGGHFLNPKGLEILDSLNLKQQEFDPQGKLKVPGLKMFHIQDIDFRSHHLLFRDGLKEIKNWSDNNPDHTPVIVLMNTKDKAIDSLKTPLPFNKDAFDNLDLEIRSVFKENKLITPDLVRGKYESLEEAILNKAWPKLNDVKGRFLFVLDEKAEKIALYLKGHPNLHGRILFVNSPEGSPEAAFRIINNPIKDLDYIKELVAKGYMVRTRADAGTKEARKNDYTKFEKALESGAQVISTDYYIPTNLFESDFKIIFKNNRYERVKQLHHNNE
ncbi:phosphatidylinositol-specific phospholipase C1-like protein [Marinifilum sp.]|uniref:phosphatidylinositol-specific phospholipase C1-like protein n=1 Tax=Marinifilum sp. TaxID=2033137 RepID=UPI003BAD951F